MRTTITVADDVAAEMERLRREDGMGPSEALNALARRGMARPVADVHYHHHSASIGLRIDVSNIGSVLDLLDEDDAERAVR